MTDFARINQPRVDKINGILAMIWKSANSQGIPSSEVRALLEGVKVGKAQETVDVPTTSARAAGRPLPAPPMAETPHYHRIGAFVDNLPQDHLRSYVTYIIDRITA